VGGGRPPGFFFHFGGRVPKHDETDLKAMGESIRKCDRRAHGKNRAGLAGKERKLQERTMETKKAKKGGWGEPEEWSWD
jgi:hypothetical protein